MSERLGNHEYHASPEVRLAELREEVHQSCEAVVSKHETAVQMLNEATNARRELGEIERAYHDALHEHYVGAEQSGRSIVARGEVRRLCRRGGVLLIEPVEVEEKVLHSLKVEPFHFQSDIQTVEDYLSQEPVIVAQDENQAEYYIPASAITEVHEVSHLQEE